MTSHVCDGGGHEALWQGEDAVDWAMVLAPQVANRMLMVQQEVVEHQWTTSATLSAIEEVRKDVVGERVA